MSIKLINFLVALKNAAILSKPTIYIDVNQKTLSLLKVLYAENLILSYNIQKQIRVVLRNNIPGFFFNNFKIFSTSAIEKHLKYLEICKVLTKNRFLLFSTSKGFCSGDVCKRKHLGGKLLAMY